MLGCFVLWFFSAFHDSPFKWTSKSRKELFSFLSVAENKIQLWFLLLSKKMPGREKKDVLLKQLLRRSHRGRKYREGFIFARVIRVKLSGKIPICSVARGYNSVAYFLQDTGLLLFNQPLKDFFPLESTLVCWSVKGAGEGRGGGWESKWASWSTD